MKTLLLLAVAALVSGLTSCNTTIGLGRDMRILGGNMEKAAEAKQGGDGGGGDTSGAPVY
jgi:predicted small secreted protein